MEGPIFLLLSQGQSQANKKLRTITQPGGRKLLTGTQDGLGLGFIQPHLPHHIGKEQGLHSIEREPLPHFREGKNIEGAGMALCLEFVHPRC